MAKIHYAFGHDAIEEDYVETKFKVFYHGTNPAKAQEILSKGLAKESYLTPIPELANSWGEVILKVNLPENWDLVAGEWYDTPTYEVISGKRIPARYISLYKTVRIPIPSTTSILKEIKRLKVADRNQLAKFIAGDKPTTDFILGKVIEITDQLEVQGKIESLTDQSGYKTLVWRAK